LLLRAGGEEIAITCGTHRDRNGQITGVVLVFRDVSRQRRAPQSCHTKRRTTVTVINRREFEHRLDRALASAAEFQRQHAVMYLDLDQFKVVNDTCGHTADDELMRRISTVLQRRLREGDTLARLGGDEFGVLLENCPSEHGSRIAEELRQAVADFPFVWDGRSSSLSVSIGLVNIGTGLFTLTEVLSVADAACYMAKEKGRNRVHVFHREDSELSNRQGEMEWVSRINEALEQGRLCLYAQEIIPTDPRAKVGSHFELLIRMLDEQGKLIPPMAFIPAAERYNLMPLIDRWVIRTAFSTLASMRDQARGSPIDMCSINLSAASLGDERRWNISASSLRTGIAYSAICFGSPNAAIANLAKGTHFIQELKAWAVASLWTTLARDVTLGYLKHLPVDFLKIDGGFVKDMPRTYRPRRWRGYQPLGRQDGQAHDRRVRREPRDFSAISDHLAQGYGVLAETFCAHTPACGCEVFCPHILALARPPHLLVKPGALPSLGRFPGTETTDQVSHPLRPSE
jgi:diguanylate cyclase (GGDEF)-like protein